MPRIPLLWCVSFVRLSSLLGAKVDGTFPPPCWQGLPLPPMLSVQHFPTFCLTISVFLWSPCHPSPWRLAANMFTPIRWATVAICMPCKWAFPSEPPPSLLLIIYHTAMPAHRHSLRYPLCNAWSPSLFFLFLFFLLFFQSPSTIHWNSAPLRLHPRVHSLLRVIVPQFQL